MEKYKCCNCGCDTPNTKDIGPIGGRPYFVHRCDACEEKFALEIEFQELGETILEPELICPWCGYVYEHYDAWAYIYLGGEDEVQCPSCGNHFDLEVENRPRFSTRRSLCDMPEGWSPDDE